MISAAVLERPGRWRGLGVAAGLCVAAAPALALLGQVGLWPPSGAALGGGFSSALGRSLAVAGGTVVCAVVLGIPCGLVAGLYRFPARRWLLGALALPLLLPSFLWAIGLSMLRIDLGLPRDSMFSGASGVVWSFTALGTPLVVFAVLIAVRLLPANALDATRLAGGERAVLGYSARAALPAGLAGALLAGVISLADPGPGQILGFSGLAGEILISFSALYDFELAARQGLAAAGVVLVAAAPLIWLAARHLTFALLPRDARLMQPCTVPAARRGGPALLGAVVLVTLLGPVTGLAGPALDDFRLDSVRTAVARAGVDTIYYAVAAGIVATALAALLAVCAARVAVLRGTLLACLMLLLVLPPAIGALGTVLTASDAAPWLDPLLRSRFTVGAVTGLRLTAVATVLLVRAIGSAPVSWAWAAAVHGVPLSTYIRRVLAPFLAGPIAMSIALVALIATADVTTVLLLQPPGQDSLPVALFTIMANAPDAIVASLCLTYLLLGCLVAGTIVVVINLHDRRVRHA